jgi:small subunit ribosomal protein S1
MMGKPLRVKVIEVIPERKRLIFSAIGARKYLRQERLKSLSVGDVITGKVVGIVRFGIFVDLGGIDGLAHISELDWLDIRHPGEIASEGEEMQVEVIGIDVDQERIQLSRKSLLPNPWEKIETKYVPGDLVEVEILKVVDFGAFARLPEGIHGLIHKTQLGYTIPGNEGEIVKSGMKVLVKILRINPDRERIALSMRQVPMEKQLDWMLDEYEDEPVMVEPGTA